MSKLKKLGYGKSLIPTPQNPSLFLTQMPWRKMTVMKVIDVSEHSLFIVVHIVS